MNTLTEPSSARRDRSYDVARERSDVLQQIIDDPTSPAHAELRMLTGDRPTGALHIGHYLASLRNRVALQDKGVETYVIIADYQVITDRDQIGAMRQNVRGLVLDYLAAGIDPARSTIFCHSAVPALNQLMLPFLSLITDAELRRNPTVKEELAATGARALSGLLLTYPVHQAADILFCHGNVVPVGRDQLPHVEQTRLIARRFNTRYAGGATVFAEPDALLSPTPNVLGIDGHKMAKSRGNAIALSATADETADLIRRARTDSERTITYEPDRRPEVASMLETAARFLGDSPQSLAEQIGHGGAARLKAVTTAAVNDGLADHRARRAELAEDLSYVDQILREGNSRANEVAEKTLQRVREVMDMAY
ncbi:tryptophan--tRNA ligase [Luteipulveratus mongoliensis]|uniref:Tryptophan--tRNA ligase n=1 Tax=Luteipulveratus mongoliensis TaxID=571913 RepID=A0A0K1JKP4_9MICO|nr:tryptophan--tRNA ligase [Luteipulveratus mongoliensis]AKU17289.1 tryptophanyl-tRNA synthetase [Luteipulveratus mongoliensis]